MSFEEWMNPPPPGTTEDLPKKRDNYENSERSYERYSYRSKSKEHRHKRSKERYRSRSRERRRRSRSGSRRRYREKKSSSNKSRRSRYSRSRSRSRSKHHRKSYSRSRSPSYNRKKSRSRSYSSSSSERDMYKKNSEVESSNKNFDDQDEYEDSTPVQENTFKNDGSFLEMFKKMQEQQQAQTSSKTNDPSIAIEPKKIPIFGKRRGGRILKTGVVEKTKNQQVETEPKDAWSVYMQEVRKYKEACCDDDSKTRPLVK